MICAAASWRLGEEDSKAWSIAESKFPYERNFKIGDNNSSPLPYAVFNILQAAKHSTKLVSMRFIDQAGLLLEQSMVYYHCKEQSSQQVLVRIYFCRIFLYILIIIILFHLIKLLLYVMLLRINICDIN